MVHPLKSYALNARSALIILMLALIVQFMIITQVTSVRSNQGDFITFQTNYQKLNSALFSLKASVKADYKQDKIDTKQDVISSLGQFARYFDAFGIYQKQMDKAPSRAPHSDLFAASYEDIYTQLEGLSHEYLHKDASTKKQNSPMEYVEGIEASLDNMYRAYNDHFAQQQGSLSQSVWLCASLILIIVLGVSLIALYARKVKDLSHSNQRKSNALESLESRLAALELARDGIVIIDKNNCLMFVNKSLCRICGLKEDYREDLVGQPWHKAFSYSDAEVIEEDIFPELDAHQYWSGEFPIYRTDGSVLHTELSFTQLPDGGKLAMIQDVSNLREKDDEKKALEAQFHQAQKMEAIGRLAGGFAHDFNNILAAMNGYAEFLVDDLDEKTSQHEFACNILSAGVQATALIDQMLAFSRQSKSSIEVLNLVKSAEETISMVQATISKKIDVVYSKAIDEALINGNATQISQLIMNLCVNAQDAIEDNVGQLGLSLHMQAPKDMNLKDVVRHDLPDINETPYLRIDDMAAGQTRLILGHISDQHDYVKISVSDSGTGMSRVTMERIFEPFFTTKSVNKGTGLGLATVHGVVLSHQGCMIIDSTLNKGTTFNVYLPLAKGACIEQDEKNPQLNVEQGSGHFEKHILVVEDQENVRDMTVKLLERLGYQVAQAVSGLDGLEMIKTNPDRYDLVITDQNMPKMSGVEMVQQVHLEYPSIPFILLSGYSLEKIQDIIREHKAIKACIKKPVSKNKLSKILEDLLETDQAA